MPVYAKQLGFSSVVVGTVYSILPITGMLAKPLFGALADRFRMQKLLFLCFQIITMIAYFSIQFVPEVPTESKSEVTLVCGKQTYFHVNVTDSLKQCTVDKILTLKTNISCSFKCDLTPELKNELCGPWNLTRDICADAAAPITTRNTLTDSDILAGKGSDSSGKQLYTKKFESVVGNSKLEFTAGVPLEHAQMVCG